MEEDSGAFKTNPRNPAQFGHFVMTPSTPGVGWMNGWRRDVSARIAAFPATTFVRTGSGPFAVFSIQLIRGGEGG
jgi:hypothetical protein